MLQVDSWLSSYFSNGSAYRYSKPYDQNNFPNGFFYTRVDTADIEAQQQLITQGFKIVEVSLFFEQKQKNSSRNSTVCRIAEEKDRDRVGKIAKDSFLLSRFHQDEQIGSKIASKIKQDWVTNFFEGNRGTSMVVAEKNDVIAGFLLLVDTTIDLIATSSDFQKQGIASDMIGFANSQFGLLTAGTQSSNVASVNLYIRNGFQLQKTQFVFHKHG